MTGADDYTHQRVAGTFVGPVVPRAGQPNPVVKQANWNSFDVPRLWSLVKNEDELHTGQATFKQAQGFENLAQGLLSFHDSLKRLRDSLAYAWDPNINESAGPYFKVVDGLIGSLASDAVAHADTGRGLERVVTALKTAKDKLGPIKTRWDRVTTDIVPEWWDKAAGDLNTQARQIIAETDRHVGDSRRQITVTNEFRTPLSVTTTSLPTPSAGSGSAGSGGKAGAARYPVPPPVPGRDPVLNRPELELQGLPVPPPVPAAPGSPVSMLPIPPGHPLLPGGGVYVLPGPGIGSTGRVVPMPQPAARMGPAGGLRAAGGTGQQGGFGMMPFAPAGGTAPRTNDRSRPGARDLVWTVAQGVPPVIGDSPFDIQQAEIAQAQQDQQFQDWFAEIATPWDTSIKPDLPPRDPGVRI